MVKISVAKVSIASNIVDIAVIHSVGLVVLINLLFGSLNLWIIILFKEICSQEKLIT